METILQQATLTAYEGCRDGSGLCHGQGRAVFSSGQVYDGQWQQGHMHGEGSIQFPDGISYSGTFASDSISGSGVYTWQGATYEGEVLNGFRHGYGRLSIADSAVVYEGQWQHGKRHGRGVLYYNADRTAYYEGDWVDDMKEGQGTSVYPSGNTYSGSWVQDQRQGQGSMHWATKGQHYTGQWLQGLPDGFGEHVWEQQRPAAGMQGSNHAMHVMHNRYVGIFKEGQRHGKGVLYYSSGARYEGQWQHGKKHGQGVYVFEDGNVFSGHFLDDRPVLATGAVLGADSTLAGAASSAGSTGTAGAAGLTDMQQVGSGTTDALGHTQPEASGTQGAAQGASAGAAKRPVAKLAATAEAASAGRKPASGTATVGDKSGKAATAGASKPGSAASKPAAAKTAAPASASSSGAAAASASTPAKRASTAARAASASASSTATGSRGSTAASQSTCVDPSASTSSCTGPSFGPATSVMQLYIADLLQEYEGQPASVYRAVSNLLVGFNTELRLIYDKYSACPSPLLDATTSCHSWAMQACQLWELLRDAHLLCRHVSLQQVCDMVQLATAPPPAVLQHRQQVEGSAAGALQRAHVAGGCYNPGTQLLFRDFCEVLVRVAAARYPLLPSLEMQLQQVMSYNMLPLLGGSSRQLAGAASRASVIAAAAAASAVAGGEGAGGCEQQLRSTEVVQYLQSHVQLLQELFGAFAEAGQGAPGAGCAVGSSTEASAMSQPQQQLKAVEHVDKAIGQDRGDGLQQEGQLWQHKAVLVWRAAACLQSSGVLEQHKISLEAVAACLLHNTLAVTDPQGVRACIDDAISEVSYTIPDAVNSSGPGPVPASPDAALKHELLFWMDAPLLLQEVLWGLVRVAALLPAPVPPAHQQGPSSAAGKYTHLNPQQQGSPPQPGRRSQSSGGGAANQPAVQAAPAAAAAAAAADQALLRYQQLFIEDCREGWDASTLLPSLQLLLEGTFKAVLGWQPAHVQMSAEADRDEAAAPGSRGSDGLRSEQLFGGDEQEGEEEEGAEGLDGGDGLELGEQEDEGEVALEEPGIEEGTGLQEV